MDLFATTAFMASTSPRQAFFASFSRRVVQALPTSKNKAVPLVVLTGALRTPSQFSHVIRQNHANLIGVGRLSILCPDLPHRISPSSVSRDYDRGIFPLREPILSTPRWIPKLAGAGVGTAWYTVAIRQLTLGKDVDIEMGTIGALFWMWAWEGPSGFRDIVTWVLLLVALILMSLRLVEWM
jgi:hypothetical protein